MRRILHIGLGPLGRMIVADLAKRGLGRIVAAVDIDPALTGKPLGDIVPDLRKLEGPDAAVKITSSLEAAAGIACDCAVLSTSSDLAKCAASLRELLARGISVVSTCEELLYP